jgi:hypothetical protein
MLGLVPWPVPFLAVLILLGSRAIARLILLPWRRTRQYGFWLLAAAAVLATVAYLTLDPVARQAGWWRWRVATAGVAWYGRPWFHFLIAFILTAVVLAAVTPWLIVKRPLPKRPDLRPAGLLFGLLLLLVIANVRSGAWWAAGVGAVVALVGGPVAVRNARTVNSRTDARAPAPGLQDVQLVVAQSDDVALPRESAQTLRHQPVGRGDPFGHEPFADQIGQLMQREQTVNFPRLIAGPHQPWFLGVELVLNLADEFLQDVFEGDHADGTTVLVHHDGEVEFPVEEELQELLQPGRLGHVDDAAGDRLQIRAAAGLETQRVEVLDVNDAEGLVEVARVAQREPGVAGAFGDVEALGQAGGGAQADDVAARAHDVAHEPVGEVEGVEQDVAAGGRPPGALLDGGQQKPHFVVGMELLKGIELADAHFVEQPLGGTVQHPDAWVGKPMKPVQRQGGPQRRRHRSPDGDGFGNQFADDDQQVTADQEADEEIEGGFEPGRAEAQEAEERMQQRLEGGFHDDAGADPAERHAHLGGADAGFEVADQALRQRGAAVALRRQRGHLRLAQFYECKLGGHEEAVQQHQHHHREELEQDRNDGVGIHITG